MHSVSNKGRKLLLSLNLRVESGNHCYQRSRRAIAMSKGPSCRAVVRGTFRTTSRKARREEERKYPNISLFPPSDLLFVFAVDWTQWEAVGKGGLVMITTPKTQNMQRMTEDGWDRWGWYRWSSLTFEQGLKEMGHAYIWRTEYSRKEISCKSLQIEIVLLRLRNNKMWLRQSTWKREN